MNLAQFYSCDDKIARTFEKARGGEVEMTNMKTALWKIYTTFLISQHHKFYDLGFEMRLGGALMKLFLL